MASPELVCSSCGASLTKDALFCSRCGTKVEQSTLRCKVCGHENPPGADLCESCGAKVSPTVGRQRVQQPETERKPRKVRRATPAKPHRETWQYIAGGAIVLLLGYFIYSEVNRVSSSTTPSPVSEQSPEVTAQRLKEIDRLQKVVDVNAGDAASTLRLANLLHDDGARDPGSIDRAVEMYKKYLAMNPDNPDARVDLGVCYFELGRRDSTRSREFFAQATKEMETAFVSHPTHQTAAFNLGIVNLHAGNLESASKWFRKAMEINPNSSLGTRAKQLLEEHTGAGPAN